LIWWLSSQPISPDKLVDEAFYEEYEQDRIDRPNEEEYRAIFRLACDFNGIAFNRTVLITLSKITTASWGRFQCLPPRDLLDHIVVRSRYYRKPEVTKENLDAAWACYYVH
jgi:hypothetical protein